MMSLSDKDDDAAAQLAHREETKQNKTPKRKIKGEKRLSHRRLPRSLCFELLTCFCGESRKKKQKNEKEECPTTCDQRERDWLTADAQYTQRRKDRHLWASPSSFVSSPRVPSVGVCAASAPVRSRFFSPSPWSDFLYRRNLFTGEKKILKTRR